MIATVGNVNAAAALPKLPQPPYMPSAVPNSLCGNHSETKRIPITKPAPIKPNAKRAIAAWMNVSDMAKAKQGIAQIANSAE